MAMDVILQAPILGHVSEIECSELSEAVCAGEKVRTVMLSQAKCR